MCWWSSLCFDVNAESFFWVAQCCCNAELCKCQKRKKALLCSLLLQCVREKDVIQVYTHFPTLGQNPRWDWRICLSLGQKSLNKPSKVCSFLLLLLIHITVKIYLGYFAKFKKGMIIDGNP